MASIRESRAPFDWNIETTKLLISLYEEHEVLYNNTLPEYKDRNKRLEILVQFSNLISETTGKVCLVADVRKKINNLRSQYFAEKLKIVKTKSGSSGDIYTPSTYWFPLLKFLDSTSTPDDSKSNLDELVDAQTMETQHSAHDNEVPHGNPPIGKKSKKRCQDDTELIQQATTTMRNLAQLATKKSTNSNIDSFCQFVSSELNSILETSSMTYVKKAKREIQKVLFTIWDDIDENPTSPSMTNYSFEDFSPVPRNRLRSTSLSNQSLVDSSPVPRNEPQSTILSNNSLEGFSPVPINEPRSTCLSNYSLETLEDSSPVPGNEPRSTSLSNYSLEDSSPVPRNDSPSTCLSENSLEDSSPVPHYPITVTRKMIGNPNIIVLKQKLYKSKPQYTIPATSKVQYTKPATSKPQYTMSAASKSQYTITATSKPQYTMPAAPKPKSTIPAAAYEKVESVQDDNDVQSYINNWNTKN